ncbi:MAG: 16S rRNA (cytidine(1402)-2'-O)-methyltransferase, partial [Chloroflexia bacterium]
MEPVVHSRGYNSDVGTLYLVSTPIGNLGDFTFRALETLRSVSLILAEDTRHTRKLLAHYEVSTPMLSYNEHSNERRTHRVLAELEGGDVALVTDAGTPGVSDPGYDLVRAALAAGHEVQAAPGASAILASLVVSGLPSDRFLYLGFLPRRSAERRRALDSVRSLPYTLVVFEAPHRLVGALADALAVLGDRRVSVGRELTKLHEDVRRSTVSLELEYWRAVRPRGEYTLVIEGAAER